MYQRNPYDHARAKQDEGEQPFKDAKEALSENEAELRRTAAPDDGQDPAESEEQRTARQEAEAGERLERIGDEIRGAQPEE